MLFVRSSDESHKKLHNFKTVCNPNFKTVCNPSMIFWGAQGVHQPVKETPMRIENVEVQVQQLAPGFLKTGQITDCNRIQAIIQ